MKDNNRDDDDDDDDDVDDYDHDDDYDYDDVWLLITSTRNWRIMLNACCMSIAIMIIIMKK